MHTSYNSSRSESTMPGNHSHGEESCSACATDIFEEKEPLWKQKEVVIIGVGAAIFLVGVYFEARIHQHILAQIAFLAATLVVGYSIITKGLLGVIKKHRVDMNLLIMIAAAGAFAIGLGEEGAAVILLFFIAEFLEDYVGDRARQEVWSLLRLAPETAV